MIPRPIVRELIEALHTPFTNEDRWEIAEAFLSRDRDDLKRKVNGYLLQRRPHLEIVDKLRTL